MLRWGYTTVHNATPRTLAVLRVPLYAGLYMWKYCVSREYMYEGGISLLQPPSMFVSFYDCEWGWKKA